MSARKRPDSGTSGSALPKRPDAPPDSHRARAALAARDADHDPERLTPWTLHPIGVVQSPWSYVHDAPRQGRDDVASTAAAATCSDREAHARIIVRRSLQNALQDLSGFERVWILFILHHARRSPRAALPGASPFAGARLTVIPPRDPARRRRGVFATRSPHRPVPIGLTAARLISVHANIVTIASHDLLDGTPVLDLKPYLPYCDAHPAAAAGWTDALPREPGSGAADARHTSEPGPRDHRWE